jgi:MoaA/NifB/PqqE/SkfB family radical SAM enzyme
VATFIFDWFTTIKMALEIISGRKARYILFRMWLIIIRITISQIKNPYKAYCAIRKIFQLKTNLISRKPIRKIVKIDGRYFWDFNQPGWPSQAFIQNFKWYGSHLLNKQNKPIESVRLVFLAITKKCILNCVHCYEGEELNKKEVLSLDSLKQIVAKYQNLGAASFIIGGGEPMCRYEELAELLKSAKPVSDFWISSSGYNITCEHAHHLKKSGLTGVSLSVDHFEEVANNKFRGHPKAMEFVREAANNCLSAGLGLATAICATREFISKENLFRYAEFSKNLGAGFIWLIEPRAEGRYRGKDVCLQKKHFEILDDFFLTINHHKSYLDYPRVLFPNYNHRRIGCAGAGASNILIDSDGYINPCPFCRKKIVYALADDSEKHVKEMIAEGCFKFKSRVS